MFRPHIQETKILVIMAMFSALSVYFVANSYNYIAKDELEDKLMLIELVLTMAYEA